MTNKTAVVSIVITSIVMGGYLIATHRIDQISVQQDAQARQLSQLIDLVAQLEARTAQNATPELQDPSLQINLSEVEANLAKMRQRHQALRQRIDALVTDDFNQEANLLDQHTAQDQETAHQSESTPVFVEQFQFEPVDSGWGAVAELSLRSAFAEPNGLSLTSAECRSTVCKIQVQFDDAASMNENTPFLPMMIPWAGESFLQTEATSTTLYVAREGYSLDGLALQAE